MSPKKKKKYDTRLLEKKFKGMFGSVVDYYKVDHVHCWNQENPACGVDKHTQCCLCREQIKKDPTN